MYSPTTRIFTKNGWTRLKNCRPKEEVWVVDPNTFELKLKELEIKKEKFKDLKCLNLGENRKVGFEYFEGFPYIMGEKQDSDESILFKDYLMKIHKSYSYTQYQPKVETFSNVKLEDNYMSFLTSFLLLSKGATSKGERTSYIQLYSDELTDLWLKMFDAANALGEEIEFSRIEHEINHPTSRSKIKHDLCVALEGNLLGEIVHVDKKASGNYLKMKFEDMTLPQLFGLYLGLLVSLSNRKNHQRFLVVNSNANYMKIIEYLLILEGATTALFQTESDENKKYHLYVYRTSTNLGLMPKADEIMTFTGNLYYAYPKELVLLRRDFATQHIVNWSCQ